MLKLSDELYIPPMGEVIRDREARKKANHEKRYAAGRSTRLNAGWTTTPETANQTLRMGIGAALRARARQMSQDVGPFKKYLTMCRSNIIGQNGIQLQCRARRPDGSLDADLNKRVEIAFQEWSYAETCTLSGKLDWLAAQRLFVTQLARDGEVLVQKVRAKNAYGFALKFIDVSYLDENYNTLLPSGNRVITSVEVDNDNRPVAYHLTEPAADWLSSRRQRPYRVRVPAEEIIHSFLIYDDESQVRGITWFHAALMPGKSLASYIEGVVTQARITAMSLGFIEEDYITEAEFQGEEDENGVERDLEIDFKPGGFTKLNPGQKVNQWDPKQPTQNHAAFKQSMEADVATSLDVNYFDLFGDMEAVNFSSARIGLGESREIWRALQDFVSTNFCRHVYHTWLSSAWMSEQIELTADEYLRLQNPYWRGRGWPYVKPSEDVKAALDAIEGGILTKSEYFASQGKDIVDFLEEKKQEMELFAAAGVEYAPAPKQIAPAPAEVEEVEEPTPKEKKVRELAYTNGKYSDEMLN